MLCPLFDFKKIIIVILFIVFPNQIRASDECSIKKYQSLPLVFFNHIPAIPVLVNDHKVYFGIDTGSQTTIISNEIAEDLNLPLDKNRSRITGVSGSANTRRYVIEIFNYAGIRAILKSVPSMPQDKTIVLINDKLEKLAGLIGADILSNYDIDYDPLDKKMTLYTIRNCSKIPPPWHGHYRKGPITVHPDGRFSLKISINQNSLQAMFDTGAVGLHISKTSAKKIGWTNDDLSKAPTYFVSGVNGKPRISPKIDLDEVIIASEKFHHKEASIIDIPSDDSDLLLGQNYMRHRRFWISYSQKTLYIQSENNILE